MFTIYNFFSYITQQALILPFWWYTKGLSIITQNLADWQIKEWRRLGLFIWIRNLFTPMFHDYTIIGRGLSFVIRLIIIVLRLISLLVKFAFKIVLMLFWLLVPGIVLFGLISSVFKLV